MFDVFVLLIPFYVDRCEHDQVQTGTRLNDFLPAMNVFCGTVSASVSLSVEVRIIMGETRTCSFGDMLACRHANTLVVMRLVDNYSFDPFKDS